MFHSIQQRLFSKTDNSPLVAFRIFFGFLMALHSILAITEGQVYRNFIAPPFTFTYIGWEFLGLLAGQGMYICFGLMALAGFCVMVGYRYRLSALVLASLWTGVYLMQKVDYNNHYYLMVLLGWFMVICPAGSRFSANAAMGLTKGSNECPSWVIWLFLFQISVVYFFAAISKLDKDWISGRFLEIMFSRYRDHQYLGFLYGSKWFCIFIAYAGFLFDLLIVPALFWKRTRTLALIASVMFHLFNSYTFRIGIFPYLGLSLTVFFFRKIKFIPEAASVHQEFNAVPGIQSRQKIIFYGLLLYAVLQLFLPLRHFLYPGNVFWTDEGYRMSWKMMGRTKSGTVLFKVTDVTGKLIRYVDPEEELSPTHRMWLAGSPDMIWQYAQRVASANKRHYADELKVYAISSVSLNRRPYRPLVDSTINLAGIKWERFRHSDWIMPLPD